MALCRPAPSTFVIVCRSSCVVNMGHKRAELRRPARRWLTSAELWAFDLAAPVKLAREGKKDREGRWRGSGRKREERLS